MIKSPRRILFDFPGLNRGKLFDPTARDHVTEPFIFLRERVREAGYDLVTADAHPVDDTIQTWFWDVPSSPPMGWRGRLRSAARRTQCRNLGLQRRGSPGRIVQRILFIGEPAVVRPDNWDPAAHRTFDKVLTWSDDLVDETRFFKFRHPLPTTYPTIEAPPFSKRGLLANISGNKSSTHPDELYSARLRTIRFFERTYPSQFGL